VETFALTRARYASDYARLGAALGVPGAAPAPGELEFLASVTSRDWQGVGMLATPEIFFAAAVTSILAPPVAFEIGTAAGFSAAILAKVLALRESECGAPGSGPLVHTIDKRVDFVFDPTQPIGCAIDLVAPEIRRRITIHPRQDSAFCASLTKNDELRFAFVDGNHRHPWPLTDVLRIQDLMASGWILMHDVDLPAVIEQARRAGHGYDVTPVYGAKHVFDFWPAEKIRSGNIGAVKIPRDRRSLGELVAKLRELPAEVSGGSWTKQWRVIEGLRAGFARRR
jgi:Methyltransferase domain